jgi:hypothetical protein
MVPSSREFACVAIASMLGFVAWALYAGPDLNWDFLHYHLYAGLHASGDALSRDFFAAGGQTYFTPYGYWPMSAMIAGQWPAKLVGAGMALIHSAAAMATWFLACQLFPDPGSRTLRLVATFLGVANPLVLTQVGTSYLDLTVAIPFVLGLAFMLRASREVQTAATSLGLAGLSFGIATALKFTNAAYCIALFAALVIIVCARADLRRWGTLLAFIGGGFAGFFVVYGPWGYQLWREFGNPLFPFFDSNFTQSAASHGSSGSATGQGGRLLDAIMTFRYGIHYRFIPDSLVDSLLRPLYMLDPVFNVYTETRAPDARFLAIFVLAPFALWKARNAGLRSTVNVLLLLFAACWSIWMVVSGNGRYLMFWFLAAGPLLVACAVAVWPQRNLVGVAAITVFACVQGVEVGTNSDFRTGGTAWSEYWVSDGLPSLATKAPVTLVSFADPSISWMSAFTHPDSRFVALPARYPGPGRLSSRLSRILEGSNTIIAVFPFRLIDRKTGAPVPAAPGAWRDSAKANGMDIDMASCAVGRLREAPAGATNITLQLSSTETLETFAMRGFFFCRATFNPEYIREIAPGPEVEALFGKIEDTCPRTYFPKGARSMCSQSSCIRSYGATDTYIRIGSDGTVASGRFGAVELSTWGTVAELSSPSTRIDCHAEVGRYAPWSPGVNMFPALQPGTR